MAISILLILVILTIWKTPFGTAKVGVAPITVGGSATDFGGSQRGPSWAVANGAPELDPSASNGAEGNVALDGAILTAWVDGVQVASMEMRDGGFSWAAGEADSEFFNDFFNGKTVHFKVGVPDAGQAGVGNQAPNLQLDSSSLYYANPLKGIPESGSGKAQPRFEQEPEFGSSAARQLELYRTIDRLEKELQVELGRLDEIIRERERKVQAQIDRINQEIQGEKANFRRMNSGSLTQLATPKSGEELERLDQDRVDLVRHLRNRIDTVKRQIDLMRQEDQTGIDLDQREEQFGAIERELELEIDGLKQRQLLDLSQIDQERQIREQELQQVQDAEIERLNLDYEKEKKSVVARDLKRQEMVNIDLQLDALDSKYQNLLEEAESPKKSVLEDLDQQRSGRQERLQGQINDLTEDLARIRQGQFPLVGASHVNDQPEYGLPFTEGSTLPAQARPNQMQSEESSKGGNRGFFPIALPEKADALDPTTLIVLSIILTFIVTGLQLIKGRIP